MTTVNKLRSFQEAVDYMNSRIQRPGESVTQVGATQAVSRTDSRRSIQEEKQPSPKGSTPPYTPTPIDYRNMSTTSKSSAPRLTVITKAEENAIYRKTQALVQANRVVIQLGTGSAVSTPKTGTPKDKTPTLRSSTPPVTSSSSSSSLSEDAYVGYAAFTKKEEEKGNSSTTDIQPLPSFTPIATTSPTSLSLIQEEIEETVDV